MVTIFYDQKIITCKYCNKKSGAYDLRLFRDGKQINKKSMCKDCFTKLTDLLSKSVEDH